MVTWRKGHSQFNAIKKTTIRQNKLIFFNKELTLLKIKMFFINRCHYTKPECNIFLGHYNIPVTLYFVRKLQICIVEFPQVIQIIIIKAANRVVNYVVFIHKIFFICILLIHALFLFL